MILIQTFEVVAEETFEVQDDQEMVGVVVEAVAVVAWVAAAVPRW